MDISSTTFSSLRSSLSLVFESIKRPPSNSATTLPPLASCNVLKTLPIEITASVPSVIQSSSSAFDPTARPPRISESATLMTTTSDRTAAAK